MKVKEDKKVIYFAGAIRGDRSMADVMREIVTFLKEKGAQVLTEHVASENPVDSLSAEEIEKRDIKWLDKANYVIAEISSASTGTGREIEYARMKGVFGKTPAKILCLYKKDREYFASPMIRGMDHQRYPNMSVKAYSSTDEVKSFINKFLE